MLYGAIIGDISGSVYEFNNIKHKPAHIMTEDTFFTDDTVMTVAVAEALLAGDIEGTSAHLKKWARKYPASGYGSTFAQWVFRDISTPYYSFGNGAAMRVSAAGWAADNIFEARYLAMLTAMPTHNHPEGIKGAEATASAIYLARAGYSKHWIKKYIENEFGYVIPSCEVIRPVYRFNETCQETVPQAIAAFLESCDFEDCIKLAISLGGDSDTLAAIAGSIAEAYYGVPQDLIDRCREELPKDMLNVIDNFQYMYSGEEK